MVVDDEPAAGVGVKPPPKSVPAGDRVRGTMRSRAFWTLSDQAVSSLTNAALAFVVARSVDRTDFGAFSVALVTFSFVIGIGRAVVCEPFIIRFSDAGDERRRRAAREATGTSASFGLVTGLLCALAAAFVGGHAGAALFALAVSLPGLLVQDCWRHVFFAEGNPRAAFFNDLVWAIVQFTVIGVLLTTGRGSVFLITLAWGMAAVAAAIVGGIQSAILPAPALTRRWLRSTRDLNLRLCADYAINMGAVNLSIYLIGALIGLAAVGSLRAAQVLLGPLQLVFFAVGSFALPLLATRAGRDVRLRTAAGALSAAVGALGAVWVLALLLLPPSVGAALLGDSWSGARSVLLPSGAVMLAVAVATGAMLALKALRRADLLVRVTLVQAPLILGLGVFGATVDGARGAAIGYAIAQTTGAALTWIALARADRGPRDWAGERDAARPSVPRPRRAPEERPLPRAGGPARHVRGRRDG